MADQEVATVQPSRAPQEFQLNVLDRVITAIAPKWGLERMRARFAAHRAEAILPHLTPSYKGARSDSTVTKNWRARGGSPQADHEPVQRSLRARSRDLVRNSPVASSASNTATTHIVGTGLRLQSKIDGTVVGLSPEQVAEKQREFERFWQYQKSRLDYEGNEPFAVLQAVAFRGTFESGDVLVVRRNDPQPNDLVGLKVQIVEADRISTPRSAAFRDRVVMGVERAEDSGRPVAYHVSSRHPGDTGLLRRSRDEEWARIPVLGRDGRPLSRLLYERRRPGQVRGIPTLAPVIEPLRQLEKLAESELTASVVQSIFTVLIETERPGEGGLPTAPEGTPEQEKPDEDAGEVLLGAGAVFDLAPGEVPHFADPSRPNDAFDPFFRAIVQQIGAAIEIPYEVLMHLYQNSYSAARAALLDAWKFFRARRTWIAESFCQLVYEWAITEAVVEGWIDAPGYFDDPLIRAAWLGTEWIGDSPGQINPKDETEAALLRIEGGISNRTVETAGILGRDWESVHQRKAEEDRMVARDRVDIAQEPEAEEGQDDGRDEPDEPTRREQEAVA